MPEPTTANGRGIDSGVFFLAAASVLAALVAYVLWRNGRVETAMMSTPGHDVIVVGAGLAGLTAARHLMTSGLRVVVVDKGRSVGGRLATRRLAGGRADHGAQFFTVRDPGFAAAVTGWQRDGLVFEWSRGWSDGSVARNAPDGYPRYAVEGGFNQLAKRLADGLDVRLATQIAAIVAKDDGWAIVDSRGTSARRRRLS